MEVRLRVIEKVGVRACVCVCVFVLCVLMRNETRDDDVLTFYVLLFCHQAKSGGKMSVVKLERNVLPPCSEKLRRLRAVLQTRMGQGNLFARMD